MRPAFSRWPPSRGLTNGDRPIGLTNGDRLFELIVGGRPTRLTDG